MSFNLTDAQDMLLSRLDDYIKRSRRGELAHSNFLTPAEVACLKVGVSDRRQERGVFFFGGYEGAERKMLFVLPSFIECEDGEQMDMARAYVPDELEGAIRAVHIRGSGYRRLTHRDYLGSILALGVERDALGDIAILSDFECVIFCVDGIFNFLIGNIDRIASDKVSVREFCVPSDFSVERELKRLSDRVA